MVFEIKGDTQLKKKYLVIEFPEDEIETKVFQDDLANRIDQCTEQSRIEFEGLVSNVFTK
jgi:hypothetical protein